jgi:hypothetical protein
VILADGARGRSSLLMSALVGRCVSTLYNPPTYIYSKMIYIDINPLIERSVWQLTLKLNLHGCNCGHEAEEGDIA